MRRAHGLAGEVLHEYYGSEAHEKLKNFAAERGFHKESIATFSLAEINHLITLMIRLKPLSERTEGDLVHLAYHGSRYGRALAQAAGKAGKHEYRKLDGIARMEDLMQIQSMAAKVGLKGNQLDTFIRRQIGKDKSLQQIISMAEVNKILWGLKAMNRRRQAEKGE